MQRWILTVTAAALLICPAFAQNRPLACQVDRSAGLTFDGGWKPQAFIPDPAKFILVLTENSLTPDSVIKVLDRTDPTSSIALGFRPTCKIQPTDGRIFCTSGHSTGASLFFSPKTMKGVVAHLYGGIDDENDRDDIGVTVFTCQPF